MYEFHITDHALVRFLERVVGCDLSALRQQFSTDTALVRHLIDKHGLDVHAVYKMLDTRALRKGAQLNAHRVIFSRFTVVLERRVVVTIITKDHVPKRKRPPADAEEVRV